MAKPRRVHAAKAVAYIRVSTEDQRNGPDAQRDAIERYAASHGLTIASWHSELGVSGGAPLDARTGLWEAIESVRESRASVLLIAKRDRLARDALAALLIERELKPLRCEIVSADGQGNGDSSEAKLLRGIMASIAEYERAIISARTKAALAARKRRGLRNGGSVPYGFRDVRGMLEIEPSEQPAIETIRNMRNDNKSLREIVETLNASPDRYPPRGERWHNTTVHRIVQSFREVSE